MFDISPLKTTLVRGPDAIATLNPLTAREMGKAAPGSMALLRASAEERHGQVTCTDGLHDLSVQGPRSCDILNARCDIDLTAVVYFNATQTDQQVQAVA